MQTGISSKAFGRLENKVKFNGYEENKTFDLNWLESFYRTYDPQLGRFWQLDPVEKSWESPYAAYSNNPVLRVDPMGSSDRVVTRQTPGGQSHVIMASNILSLFDGSEWKLKGSDVKVRPAACTLRSFKDVRVWVAAFNGKRGSFLGYRAEDDLDYDDFVEERRDA